MPMYIYVRSAKVLGTLVYEDMAILMIIRQGGEKCIRLWQGHNFGHDYDMGELFRKCMRKEYETD